MKKGILVISHGSRDPGWVALVDAAVQQAAEQLGVRMVGGANDVSEMDAASGANEAIEISVASGANEAFETSKTTETSKTSEANETIEISETSEATKTSKMSKTNEKVCDKQAEHVVMVASFLEIVEQRLIQDGLDELAREGATDILVVPLFVSSGSTHVDEIAQGFGSPPIADVIGDLGRFVTHARITYGKPIDNTPEIIERLLANISDLSQHPEAEALLLVGHGSKERVFHERWMSGLQQMAQQMQEQGGFARSEAALLLPNQAPERLHTLLDEAPDRPVIVVPLFISEGYFTRKVVPDRLQGMNYRYNGKALLPGIEISRWLASQVSEWLNE